MLASFRSHSSKLARATLLRSSAAASAYALPALSARTGGAMLSSPKRFLNIHEYQAKTLMADNGVSVQKGWVATSVEEAVKQSKEILATGAKGMVVKAQIHAGGRGKGYMDNGFQGGVHVAYKPEEVRVLAEQMLGAHLITKQTGPEGQEVFYVLQEPIMTFDRELYLAILMDRSHQGPVMVASKKGGMDIEAVAKKNPNDIFKEPIDIHAGLLPEQTHRLAEKLGFTGAEVEDACEQMTALYDMFINLDCTQVEINPMVVGKASFTAPYKTVAEWCSNSRRWGKFTDLFAYTEWNDLLAYSHADLMDLGIPSAAAVPLAKAVAKLDATGSGKVFCLDAKLNFDNNAQFRQKKVFSLRDERMEDPREVAAAKYDLNYIALDGNIGCMVNGAGLAMATMDIIQQRGGSPANFLDVGGGATEEQVEAAFRILTSDTNVQAILVNIFGGIMKCDVIAQGIVNAAKAIDINVPIVVRLEGTNVEQGNEILMNSGIEFITAGDLDQAAQKAVQSIAKKRRKAGIDVETKTKSKKALLDHTGL